MVDLTQPNPCTPLIQHQKEEHDYSLSSTIERCIGKFNLSQFIQVILISLSWFFDGQQTFITIFTDASPSWHCTSDQSSCNSNMCLLPKDSWVWDKTAPTSIISDWNLECEGSFVTSLPASMFFLGCFIGGLVLITLSDSSLGRKNMLFFSCLLMSVSSFLVIFSTNVWTYSALKFFSGFGRATVGTSALVLVTELVAKEWRGKVGAIGFFLFSLGFLSLPGLAYPNRNFSWKNLYLWTSLPAILYCVLGYLFVLESPRWLLIKGRKEEAVKVLKRISLVTHSELNFAISNMSLEGEVNENMDMFSTLKTMIKNKWSSKRLLAVMAMGLGTGLLYYGMPLGLEIFSFNIYLSVTFNALSEIPSSLIACILLDKFNRRSAFFTLTIISGITSVLSIMEGKIFTRLQMVFELISFFCACTALDVSLLYTTELFPTSVRNSALALVRQASVLAGAFGPMLVAVGREHKFICYGIFGLVIVGSGMLVMCLPETKNKTFCDTMNEEENREKVERK